MSTLPTLPTCLLAALLILGQLGLLSACGGCSARHEKEESSVETTATASGTDRKTVPAPSPRTTPSAGVNDFVEKVKAASRPGGLSANAEITAAYLALLQAMSHGDENAAVEAAGVLATGRGELALPEAHWIEAALWLMERKSINSVPFLQKACEAHPESRHLALLRAEALSDHNFAREAMAVVDGWLAQKPDDPEVLLQKGILQFKEGHSDEAVATFKSIGRFERSGFVDYYLARALSNIGRDGEALAAARRAVKELPDFDEAVALLAFLCERTDNLEEARAAYEKLLRTSYSPRDIALRLINVSLRLNQPEKALEYYAEGPKEDRGFKILAATLFTEAGHLLQAEKILRQFVAEPDAPDDAFLFLADLVWRQTHDVAKTMEWVNRVPDNSPAAVRKFLLVGQVLAQSGRNDEALKALDHGRSLFPDEPDFVDLQTRILVSTDRRPEALDLIRKGVDRWPDDTDLAFLYGSLLAEDGRKAEALTVMEGIVEKDNTNAMALNYVGYTLADENRDIERALTQLKRANELSPGQFFILDSLAWAYFRAGNLDEAWKCIGEAVRLDKSGDAEIWEHYGDIARARGLTGEARDAYRKALGKNRSDTLQKKLDELR